MTVYDDLLSIPLLKTNTPGIFAESLAIDSIELKFEPTTSPENIFLS